MPNFLGGLAEGLQQGGFNAVVDNLIKRQQQERTAKAIEAWAASQGSSPHPAAPLAALSQGAQPAPAAPAPFTPGKPPAPGQPDPLAPQPAAQPAPPMGAPTGQPGAEAPTGMSVNPALADPEKEGESIILNLWRSTKAANPKADPFTIMSAVEAQIAEVKGIAPITKATMQGQIAYMRAQTDDMYKMHRLSQYDHDWLIKMQNAKTAEERVRLNSEYQQGRLKIEQERADTYEEGTQFQHKDRQDTNQTRVTVADLNNRSREGIAALREKGLNDRSIAALKGKRGGSIASGVSRVLSYNPSADVDQVIETLSTAYGGDSGSSSAPAPKSSGGDGGVQRRAKAEGITLIRRRSDGSWDAKDKSGRPGIFR